MKQHRKKKQRQADFWAFYLIIAIMWIGLLSFNAWAKAEISRIDADLESMRQDLAEMQERAKADKLINAYLYE